MQNWIPNWTEQTWNQNGLGFQNNTFSRTTEPQHSLENTVPSSFGNPFLSHNPLSQPSLQTFGSVPVSKCQEGFSNLPYGASKTFEEQDQFIVHPKDPFASSWKDNRHATPWRPREYSQQHKRTTQLLLSRCSQEFCQRDVIKRYFETVVPGKVVQVQVKPERGSAIVSFLTEEDAEKALQSGAPQSEYRLRMRYFISKDTRRRDSPWNRDTYLSSDGFGNEEEASNSKMDTEELPAFETSLFPTADNSEQNTKWNSLGASKESLADTKTASDEEVVRKLKRESRFAQSVVSDDEVEVEHIDETGWRIAGEKQQLSSAHNLIGTCLEMCPAEERSRREAQRDLSIFEIDYTVPTVEGEPPKVDHSKAVKKYVRSAACQEAPRPNEIRPPHILEKTMEYLIENIVDRKDCSFAEVHNFVRDRTRSIRQDFTFQGVRNELTIEIIEKTVRFHILSEQRLCEEDPSVYSSRQNMEQLDKCLISLREMYRERRTKSLPPSPNEGEFQAYYILSHFDPHSVLAVCRELDAQVLKSRQVDFALKVYQAFGSTNYVGFFRLLRQASYLMASMMQQHFTFIRKSALFIMQKCYSRFPIIPLIELEELLAFEDTEDTLAFCESLGFVSDYLEDGTRVLRLDSRLNAEEWTKYHPRRSLKHIEPKSKGFSVKDIMMGKTEMLESFNNRNRQDSIHVEEPVSTKSVQRENAVPKDALPQSTTKLSANAPEFIPSSLQPTSCILPSPNFALPFTAKEKKEESFAWNKNSNEENASSFGPSQNTMSFNQEVMEEVVLSNSVFESRIQTKNDNTTMTGLPSVEADKELSVASPVTSVLDQNDEPISKIQYSFHGSASPKIANGNLKRKIQFGPDENVRKEGECLTEGKKSRTVEEQSEHNVDNVEETEDSKETTDKTQSENELWILGRIRRGNELLEFLPRVRYLKWRYKAIMSKSNSDAESLKELSAVLKMAKEIEKKLLHYLEEVNTKDTGIEDKKLMDAVRSVRNLCEDLKVFISKVTNVKDERLRELEKMNSAARSFMRAPAEAVKNYDYKVDSRQTPKEPSHTHHVKTPRPKVDHMDAKELKHVVYLITFTSSKDQQQVISQGLKVLSFGETKDKENILPFIVPLTDGYCKVRIIESVFADHFYTLSKPFILTVGVSDAYTTNWNAWKKQLKSVISKYFTMAVTLLVFVNCNDFVSGETLDPDDLVNELSDLRRAGFVTSISVLLTDRKHLSKYSDNALSEMWETLVHDAERIFQVLRYTYMYPSISTGYYTTLELAMSCVRLSLEQLRHGSHSLETLFTENLSWMANKLLSISNACLPNNKYRENFDIIAKTFRKLSTSTSQIFDTLFHCELSNDELILFMMDHADQWWQNMERTMETWLGSVSNLSVPIRLNRLLEERDEPERPWWWRLDDSATTATKRKSRVDVSQNRLPVSETLSPKDSYEEFPNWFLVEKQRLSELEEKMRDSTIQDVPVLKALMDTKHN